MGVFDAVPTDAPVARTRGSDFWLHDGTVYGRTRPKAAHGELEDVVDAVSKIRQLTGGKRYPLVFDARAVGWLHVRAREHIHRQAAELFTAAAVIVRPNSVRIFSRALLGVARIEIPVGLFVDDESAGTFISRSRAA